MIALWRKLQKSINRHKGSFKMNNSQFMENPL